MEEEEAGADMMEDTDGKGRINDLKDQITVTPVAEDVNGKD